MRFIPIFDVKKTHFGMNKILLGLFFVLTAHMQLKSQVFKDKSLQQSALLLNTIKTASDCDSLFKKFLAAEKEAWVSYYYASAALYLKSELQNPTGPSVAEASDMAAKFASAAIGTEKNNAEVNILSGLVHLQLLQIGALQDDPKITDLISENIKKAESNSPNSPRLSILKAKLAERLGNKSEAVRLYQKAKQEFDSKSSTLSGPDWGRFLIKSTD